MIKPYIVCHMMTSVDGRIDCAMTEHLPGVQEYYDTLDALDAPTRISGRVTAELEMALPGKFKAKTAEALGKEAFSKAAEAVRTAVKLGYRLIDTAQAYGNERGVGEGVRTCGVPREELFVASKVAAELKTYDEAKKSIDETLEKMGLDYLDQMIIHSPQPWNQFRVEKRYFEENKAVWRALEDAQSEGKIKVIGVSNFLRDDLENLLSDCRVKPMVNQILLHISNTDLALLDYCREQSIQVEAYSPIAHGEALKNPAIAEMAKKYGVNAAQLCIRYVIELGAVALPKTANPDHMASNAAVDFTISSEDTETLKLTDRIADYGEFNIFPVFSGKPLA